MGAAGKLAALPNQKGTPVQKTKHQARTLEENLPEVIPQPAYDEKTDLIAVKLKADYWPVGKFEIAPETGQPIADRCLAGSIVKVSKAEAKRLQQIGKAEVAIED